ncbi:hypothetical protein, partial [Commensalibacter sp. Nvir]|uniref:hypothetical protein n=1 Tax=Commensalibacter sp. Nvir TaxID=3069817 RepID=UPI0030C8374F
MPRHFIIAFYCVILILGMILRPHAFATQKWANTCALINVSAISANTNQLTMNNYNIKPIYNSNLSMKAAEIIIKKSNTLSIDNEQYIRINNATSMGLMSLILQHYIPSCNASYYDALLSPFIKKLQDQGSVSFTWNKAIFQKENFVIQISRINIIITSTHKLMHLHLKFFGLSASNSTTEPVLLPRDGSVDMEMDPKTYSILLANQKQNLSSYKTSYPLTINSLMLANATSTLTASGTISIN